MDRDLEEEQRRSEEVQGGRDKFFIYTSTIPAHI